MEKNLEYGDCFNFLGSVHSLFVETIRNVAEKIIDKKTKKD